MRCSVHNLIFACSGFGLLLGFAAPTEAGFISPTDASLLGGATSTLTEGAGFKAPIEQQPTTPPPSLSSPFEQFVLLGYASTGGSSTGMGSGSNSGSSSAVPAAILEPVVCSPATVTGDLSGEPGINLPAIFLDGIFRPPQG